MKTPILGSTYVARSVNAADNRMVNLFPEIVPEGGKEPAFLQRAPGLNANGLGTLGLIGFGTGPIRGLHVLGTYLYAVNGNELYRITTGFSPASLGTISGGGSVSIADNGTQLFIATSTGTSYIYDTGTTILTEMVAGVYTNFPGAVTVAFIDGFFVVNKPNTNQVYCSASYDGLTWDATNFASAESSPDNVVGVFVIHNEIWIFGNSTVEVWYNTGSAGFPFAPIQGVLIEIGCASPYVVAQMDNSLFWLSNDQRGHGIVYRADGYNAKRISTHAVEWQIQSTSIDLSSTSAFTYQQEGHQFYVLLFVDPNPAWVYDSATQAWHERAGWDGAALTRYEANCQAFFSNLNIVGDWNQGKIYKLDLDFFSFAGVETKWLRSWRALPTGANNLKRSIQHSLQLDCEPAAFGSTANVALRWSDDGGHSWSTSHTISFASSVSGERVKRVIWRRLGGTMKLRDRVYEVSSTDAVKMVIMGAELLMSPTDA